VRWRWSALAQEHQVVVPEFTAPRASLLLSPDGIARPLRSVFTCVSGIVMGSLGYGVGKGLTKPSMMHWNTSPTGLL
jgi:hypothetical protein